MSSSVPPKPTNSAPGPRPAARPGPPPAGGPVIDPIKLLKKWKYVLAAAVIVGGFVGIAGHYVWAYTYPIYDSVVTFEASPPQNEKLIDRAMIDEDELEQFMATQSQRMMSQTVLQKVAQDPRLQAEAVEWCKPFIRSGGTFDDKAALEELEKDVSARPVGGTSYVRLKVSWHKPKDVTGIARLVKETYLSDLQTSRSRVSNQRRAAIQKAINDQNREIENLTERRNRLLRDEEISGLSQQQTITRERLSIIARDRNNIALELRSMESQLAQMEKMIESEGGVRYTDTQRQTVENSPIVQQFKANKEALETRLKELRQMGFMPSHREYKMVEQQISAIDQQLSITRERDLARLFDAERDFLESEIRNARAQEADLIAREEGLEVLLQDMTRTITEIMDITDQIEGMNRQLAERKSDLGDVDTSTSTDTANRMIVAESERVPERATLPKLFLSVPAGIMLISGLTAFVILATEFLDQRVKSPADLASMPRTKILGTIPLADEDPTVGGQFDLVMRDAPRSAVAESFRQIRTGVIKKLGESGHKTCLVFSGMPGSGATSVTSNLGLACAGIGQRVLIIDANFRRPSMHRLFGLNERPGLGDVLAGEVSLDDAVQTVTIEGGTVHVLTAGSPSKRIFERLGTDAMNDALMAAKNTYDITFVDTAPAIVAGDASSLAQRCDASIQVTRAMSETRGMVGRVKNEFVDAPAEMLGVVVNAVRSAAGGYMKKNIRTSTEYHAAGSIPEAPAPSKRSVSETPGENAA